MEPVPAGGLVASLGGVIVMGGAVTGPDGVAGTGAGAGVGGAPGVVGGAPGSVWMVPVGASGRYDLRSPWRRLGLPGGQGGTERGAQEGQHEEPTRCPPAHAVSPWSDSWAASSIRRGKRSSSMT